jgi:hypothetical protein
MAFVLNVCVLLLIQNPPPDHLRNYCDVFYSMFVIEDDPTDLPIDVVVECCEAVREAVLHVDKPRPGGEHAMGEITRQ